MQEFKSFAGPVIHDQQLGHRGDKSMVFCHLSKRFVRSQDRVIYLLGEDDIVGGGQTNTGQQLFSTLFC